MTSKMSPHSPKQMGECLAKFEPSREEVFKSLVVTILVTIAGLSSIIFAWRAVYLANGTLPFVAENRWSWLYVILANVFGIVFTAGGTSYLLHLKSVSSQRTEFYENGFRIDSEASIEEILWMDVKLITESAVLPRSGIFTGGVKSREPKAGRTTFFIETHNDKIFVFDRKCIKDLQHFESFLREQAEKLSLNWNRTEHHD